MVAWASVAPDLDGLGLIAEAATANWEHPLTWWSDYHHVLGHNLGFALLCTAAAAFFAERKKLVSLLVFASFHLHLLGDLVGSRGPEGEQWPLPYLLPFSSMPSLVWSGQWALNAWPNILLTALLLVTALVLAVKRGYSPVSLFSRRADSVVVETLRRRFRAIS
jgi:inner membrane protein